MNAKRFTGYLLFRCYNHAEPVVTRLHVGEKFELVTDRHPVPCNDCGRPLSWRWGKQIFGVFSQTMKCDPRCWNAISPECSCQCGGINHSSGHDIKPVKVAEVEKEQRGIKAKYAGYCEGCGHAWLEGHYIMKVGDEWQHAKCPYYEIEHITTVTLDLRRAPAREPFG